MSCHCQGVKQERKDSTFEESDSALSSHRSTSGIKQQVQQPPNTQLQEPEPFTAIQLTNDHAEMRKLKENC